MAQSAEKTLAIKCLTGKYGEISQSRIVNE